MDKRQTCDISEKDSQNVTRKILPYKCGYGESSESSKQHKTIPFVQYSEPIEGYFQIKIDNTNTQEKSSSFPCDDCEAVFNNISSLNRHKIIHTGEKYFECDICHKVYTLKENLKCHKRIHTGVKPYQCNVCNSAFLQKSHLKSHHARNHSGEKQKCDRCKKSYRQSGQLKQHKCTSNTLNSGTKCHDSLKVDPINFKIKEEMPLDISEEIITN